MTIRQRQIVEVEFRLPPDGKFLRHPCIVLSNEEINDEESAFVAVMMTTDQRYDGDEYSFKLLNEMLNKPHGKQFCAARIHLVGHFLYKDVIKNSQWGSEIRIEPFKRLLTTINRITFQMQVQLNTGI
jgi:hypothetical protein